MTHQIIKTDNYILVVDDSEIKVGNYFYSIRGIVEQAVIDYPKNEHHGVIIAHLPINGSPILEGVDLLPPIEDDVEQLAQQEFDRPYIVDMGTDITPAYQQGFVVGYNKAREKYKYTEEHVFGFLTYYNSINFNKSEYRYKHPTMDGSEREYNRSIDRKILAEYIQSLHQYPTSFECEMEIYMHSINGDVYKPKTTTINGHRVWVGKYLFS